MKLQFFAVLVLINFLAYSQVGIGTASPTKDLDINGELRIRNLPYLTDSEFLACDNLGNIGKYRPMLISDISSVIASSNIDILINTSTIINNINLGLSTTIFIPANKEAIIIIDYSVPIGVSSFTNPIGYYGITFRKNGSEEVVGSRKFSFNINGNANMVTVFNHYIENFTSSSIDRYITYSLNGYVETHNNSSNTFRFNMWNPLGDNYNWGKATLSKIVYLR